MWGIFMFSSRTCKQNKGLTPNIDVSPCSITRDTQSLFVGRAIWFLFGFIVSMSNDTA